MEAQGHHQNVTSDSYPLCPRQVTLNHGALSVLIYKMEIINLSALACLPRRPWCGKPHMRHSLWKGLVWSTITGKMSTTSSNGRVLGTPLRQSQF